MWRTQRRFHADGSSYAWLVKTSALVNYLFISIASMRTAGRVCVREMRGLRAGFRVV